MHYEKKTHLLGGICRKFIANIEIILASFGFLLLFVVLLFRNTIGLSSKILVFVQQNIGESHFLFDAIHKTLNWISNNSQWTSEGAQWLWVWFVMLGLSEAERFEENLKIDFLFQIISSQKVESIFKILLDTVFLSSCIFLFILSFQEIERSKGATPTTLPMSNAWLYSSMTVGLFCISIRIMLRIQRNVTLLASLFKNKDMMNNLSNKEY